MDSLSLENICAGAVEEVFQRELKDVLKNISDPNTDSEKKRKITFTFEFDPFADRSGAEVTFHCASKLVPVESVKGNIFVSRAGGDLRAYPRDPRQDVLFQPQPEGSARN